MRKNIRIINLIVIPLALVALVFMSIMQETPAQAEVTLPEPKNMGYAISYKTVDRAEVLEKFFEQYNSPLKPHADTFVEVADKYDIDYRLLPAISCMESTCGKYLIKESNNPFGWGVYGNNYIKFESYDHAIEGVGRGLNENYFSKGFDTPRKIAPVYTPPNSHNWYNGVSYFSNQIDEIAQDI